MRRTYTTLLASGLFGLSACSTYGPRPIYGPNGIIVNPEPQTNSVYSQFVSAAANAYTDGTSVSAIKMHRIGRDLVQINCHEFYRRMGRNERTSRIARNIILPITTALNGLMALRDWTNNTDSKEDILQIINIAAVGGTSALNIYDEHFLFKSDNIDSVRTMTMSELKAFRDNNQDPPKMFSGVVAELLDYQNLCTPSHLVVTARNRIEGVKQDPPAGTKDENGAKKEDEDTGG
jgi:hypothetical protein